MPYRVNIDQEHQIVRVVVEGEITMPDALAGRRESIEACRRYGYNRIMTDMRAGSWKLELEDALDFGITVASEPFPKDIRFAALARRGDILPEVMVRAVALSGVPIKLVSDEQAALRYLC